MSGFFELLGDFAEKVITDWANSDNKNAIEMIQVSPGKWVPHWEVEQKV